MSVADCQERVSSREWSEWLALAAIEPWGDVREDYRTAQICAVLATLLTGRRQDTRRFMPWLRSGPREEPVETVHAKVRAMVAAGVLRKIEP